MSNWYITTHWMAVSLWTPTQLFICAYSIKLHIGGEAYIVTYRALASCSSIINLCLPSSSIGTSQTSVHEYMSVWSQLPSVYT